MEPKMIPEIGSKPTREEALAYCEARLAERHAIYNSARALHDRAGHVVDLASEQVHEIKAANQKFLEQLGYVD
jgi:hypothetical protein